jgi:transcriptional regulator with XRE-family HTH domain
MEVFEELEKAEIGKRVKTARDVYGVLIDQKITQAKLGELIGQSRSYIGDIEAGRTYPTLSVLFGISAALKIPIEYFVSNKYQLKDYLFNNQSDTDKLVEAYLMLSDTGKQAVWNLINSLTIMDKTKNEQAPGVS